MKNYKHYNQNDYPHVLYDHNPKLDPALNDYISDCGCGICAACMLVENLLHITCSVEECAELALSCGARVNWGTDPEILVPKLCEKYGMGYAYTMDAHEALRFLQEEKGMVIAWPSGEREDEGYPGLFTKDGHFITLVAAEGSLITVLDPSGSADKFEDPFRAARVQVFGDLVLADMKYIAEDCGEYSPAYILFWKK